MCRARAALWVGSCIVSIPIKTAKPQTFEENKQVAKRGGKVAGIARQALEAETGKPVITEKNAFDFQQLVTDIVEDAAELPEQSAEKKEK